MQRRHRHSGLYCLRRSIPRLYAPLSTLRRHPREYLRMTRGRCGSLVLHRNGLAPSTSCRPSRRTAAQYPAHGLPCERFELNLTVSPRITRGRGGWLGLTPWKTFTSYPLPASWRTLLRVNKRPKQTPQQEVAAGLFLPRDLP